jgi:FtsP/CotA-like multicopper oxidase with cupredoxin domain
VRRLLRGPAALLPALAVLLLIFPAHPAGAKTRHYWVAAEPARWNAVPNGWDAIHGTRVDPADSIFPTVTYRRYSRGWRRPLGSAADRAAGVGRIPGPLIRGRVGDRILVHFKNLDTATRARHSMHFHGVEYEVGSDGAFIPGFSGPGAVVPVGGSFVYELHAGRGSAGVWPYHDHSTSMDASIAGGMYGAVSILGRRERRPDREFVVAFAPLGSFQTVNGRGFVGNTPVFKARVGEVVQWDVIAMGSEHHTFHVHGHRWRGADGVPLDTRTIGPAESFRVRWREDAPGAWLYHCHVESHMAQGMIGLYRVRR